MVELQQITILFWACIKVKKTYNMLVIPFSLKSPWNFGLQVRASWTLENNVPVFKIFFFVSWVLKKNYGSLHWRRKSVHPLELEPHGTKLWFFVTECQGWKIVFSARSSTIFELPKSIFKGHNMHTQILMSMSRIKGLVKKLLYLHSVSLLTTVLL